MTEEHRTGNLSRRQNEKIFVCVARVCFKGTTGTPSFPSHRYFQHTDIPQYIKSANVMYRNSAAVQTAVSLAETLVMLVLA